LYSGDQVECGNAFSEISNDPIDQRERFRSAGRHTRAAGDDERRTPMDEDFIRSLEYGMRPPTGGLGVGIDRLADGLCNQDNTSAT